jgi:hypothetical protein
MPLVRVIDDCYAELERMRKEIADDKKAKSIHGKTTLGEVICRLIRERGQ